MRLFVFLLIAAFGCQSIQKSIQYGSAKRSMARIKKLAENYPELLDSLKLITHDTARTTGINDDMEFKGVAADSTIDGLAKQLVTDLITVDGGAWESHPFDDGARGSLVLGDITTGSIPGSEIQAHQDKVIAELRKKLSTLGCPKLKKDTVYTIKIFDGKDTVKIPITFSVDINRDKGSIKINAKAGKFVYVKTKTDISFNCPPKSIWTDQWFWISLGLFVIFILLIIISIRRR